MGRYEEGELGLKSSGGRQGHGRDLCLIYFYSFYALVDATVSDGAAIDSNGHLGVQGKAQLVLEVMQEIEARAGIS